MSLVFSTVLRRKAGATAITDLVAAGGLFSLSVQSGRAWSWGYNNFGQLGINVSGVAANRSTPVSVLGAVKTFCKISAGANFSLAIDKNGRAWGWGRNISGEVGDNTITQRLTPVSILGGVKTFCHIAASLGNHSLALTHTGRAWAWGDGANGRLGDNTIVSKRTPVSVLGAVKTFCKIAAGNAWSLAIDKNGRAWAWGNGGDGRLGRNSTVSSLTPVSVLGVVKTFCEIAAGNATSAAIDKNGRIWSWGFNNSGQLGNGANVQQLTPVSLAGAVKTFCKISLSNGQTLALDKNGRAWGWGFNTTGLLGDNSVTARNTPVSVAGAIKTFCQIAAGNQHALAIDKNNNTWAWGPNDQGQLGANLSALVRTPKSIVLGANKTFCQVNIGGGFSIMIDRVGKIWSWGVNTSGFIGDNTTTARYTPINLAGVNKTFCKVASGGGWTLAIANTGRLWGWGLNTNGRIGDNSTTQRNTPVSILGAAKTFCQIDCGNAHSLAIDKNGRAWAWGNNTFGALGNNSTVSRNTPVSVLGAIKTFCQVAAGTQFSLALRSTGRLWGWGDNAGGKLARDVDALVSVNTPISVALTNRTFCKIAAGSDHGLAIDLRGRCWGWGYNDFGQVGNTNWDDRDDDVFSVQGAVKTFCEIAGGFGHSVAIDRYGKAWGWGYNLYGQLGDNTSTQRNTPVSVVGANKTFCKIAAINNSTIAIDKNGKVWGWGRNDSGQLPIQPENVVVLTPVRVYNI
jgi:alpha-tubulin suppressor-like RCC1 family protein